MPSFFLNQQTSKQNHVQSKRTNNTVLGTSPGAIFSHINEWEAISNSFWYQSYSKAPEGHSWRSATKSKNNMNKTTSASNLTINNCLNSLFEAWRACQNKRLSASSWLQDWIAGQSASKLFEGAFSKWLPWSQLFLREFWLILNSSVLLSLFLKNTWSFFAIGVSSLTDILTPMPRRSLFCPLIQSVL